MEDEFDELEDSAPSEIYENIESYLNDKFNFPGTDGTKLVKSATGFEGYLQDRFR